MVESRGRPIVQPVRKLALRRTDRYWVAWSDPRLESSLHRVLNRFWNFDAFEADELKYFVVKCCRSLQVANRQRYMTDTSASHHVPPELFIFTRSLSEARNPLSRAFTAIGSERCTSAERRLIGCEKQDGLGNLFGPPHALERYRRDQAGFPLIRAGKPGQHA